MNIVFNDEDKVFDVESESNKCSFHYKLQVNKDFEKKKFKIYFFYKEEYSENDIYQVYVNKERVGWIFPINVLTSTEHKEANNIHFLRYAYVAYKSLIQEVIQKNLIKNENSLENFDDYISQGTFLFILSRETLDKANIDNFKIDNFLPSFYLQSLVYKELGKESLKYRKNILDFPTDNRMNINEMSTELLDNPFIAKLFKEIFPFQNDEILDFFYCYQAIELLMEKIYEHRILNINFLEQDMKDTSKIKEILHQLKEETSEKSRINLLENRYMTSPISNDYSELKSLCIDLLSSSGKTVKELDNLKDFLYPVRNLLFHDYRAIKKLDILEEIPKEFSKLISILVIRFSLPKSKG